MKYKLFLIYDTKAEGVAGPIMIFPREAPAIRHFHDLCRGTEPYNKHPEDYELREAGTLDEESGMILPRTYTDEQQRMMHLLPETVAYGKEAQ